MEKVTVRLGKVTRQRAKELIDIAPDGWNMVVQPPKRSTEQNNRMWAMLQDIADQVVWYGKRLSKESWKHIFTASLYGMEVVPNLDGDGVVALGYQTSNMNKAQLTNLMTLIEAFGAEHEVKFTAPAELFDGKLV